MNKHIKIKSFNKLHILPIVMLLIIGGSCEKETYMIPDDFKQFFVFPAGSWWAYKNQFGVYDTLTLKSIDSKMESTNIGSGELHEEVTSKYHTINSGNMVARTFYGGKNGGKAIFHFCFFKADESFFNDMTNFPVLANNVHKLFACNVDVEWSILDSTIVNNDKYLQVYFNQASNIPESLNLYPFKCYFVKNIGLIKKELQNGEIWELVDYKINK